MGSIASKATEWLMAHRTSLPPWVNNLMTSVARDPDGLLGRLAGRMLRAEDPAATTIPSTPRRLYIAPTNYSGQGFAWARAVEAADSRIGARNAAIILPGGFGFEADSRVPITTVNSSADWAAAEWQSVSQFTHVLIEAERPLFGRRFDRDLVQEIHALEYAGVSVAYMCHGTDVRDPAGHALRTPWSLYPSDPRTAVLQEDAAKNRALLAEVRRPTFVSTPDLIADVPWGIWCPVVVDTTRFSAPPRRAHPGAVKIIHAASAPLQKGSHYIEPALAPLIAAGLVEYTLVTETSSSAMPALFASADIVIDQFRAGSYGVAACEAMSSGAVVIGHVLPQVREHVQQISGLALPILEATPDTLRDVVNNVISTPDEMHRIGLAGAEFVRTVHSGAASARVLIDQWIERDAELRGGSS